MVANRRKVSSSTDAYGLSPEAKLLLCLAGVAAREMKEERARELAPQVDWPKFITYAQTNRMVPLVYSRLRELGIEGPPKAVLDQLRHEHRCSTIFNMHLTGHLIDLLKALETAGIRALAYKGLSIESLAYEKVGLRQFKDLDILVAREDVLRARDILIEKRFRPKVEVPDHHTLKHLDREGEFAFEGPGDLLEVELHCELVPREFMRGLEMRSIWPRVCPLAIGGYSSWTIPHEELFLALCIHGGEQHQWKQLKWLCDIAHLAARPETDWKALGELADRIGRRDMLLGSIYLCHTLLDLNAPAELLEEARSNPLIVAQGANIRGRLFRERGSLPGYAEWCSYVRAAEPTADEGGSRSLTSRGLYLRGVWKPDAIDRSAISLPPGLGFVHYLIRPIRLAYGYGWSLFGRIR